MGEPSTVDVRRAGALSGQYVEGSRIREPPIQGKNGLPSKQDPHRCDAKAGDKITEGPPQAESSQSHLASRQDIPQEKQPHRLVNKAVYPPAFGGLGRRAATGYGDIKIANN